jgi:hypothetical protein
MLYLFSCLILLTPKFDKDLLTMRAEYYQAINSEEIAIKLDKELGAISNKTFLQMGYFGANKMILAKFAFWPNTKYALFVEGKAILEEAIKNDPKNIELIFLRYPVQLNAPSILDYNQNVASDKKTLVNEVKSIKDKDLKSRILVFLLSDGKLTEAERKAIQ